MKFTIAALLLSAASAFVAQPNAASNSALFSTIPGPSGSSGPGSGLNGYRYGNRYGADYGTTRTGVPVSASGLRNGITPDGRVNSMGRYGDRDTAFPSDYAGRRNGMYGRRRYRSRYGRYNDRYGRWSAYENSMNLADNEVLVQGNSLKTWTYNSPMIDRVQVAVRTEGRPFDTEVDLWQGPDNTPQKMRVYSEDGAIRPFQVLVETPRAPNTVAIRNVGQMEFPMIAAVQADTSNRMPMMDSELRTVQGGALRTYPFDPTVESVQVMITTDGRPLTARIELLQGPNNNKQVIEVYCEDGYDRPFYVIMETPGSGNVVRVVNTATVEFPMSVAVEAYQIGSGQAELEPVLGEGYGYNMGAVGQW